MGNRESALLQAVHNPVGPRPGLYPEANGHGLHTASSAQRNIPTAELDRIAGLKTVHEDDAAVLRPCRLLLDWNRAQAESQFRKC